MKNPPRNIDLTCFNWVKLILKTDLNYHSKYIALYLSTYMNLNQDMAFPSISRIAGETGMSRSSVFKWLAPLEQDGWLIKQSGSSVESNKYWINIPKMAINDTLGVVRDTDQYSVGVVRHTDHVVRDTDQGSPPHGLGVVRDTDPNNNINNKYNNNGITRTPPIVPPAGDVSESFSVFYKAYPKKVGKDAAFKAWKKLSPSEDLMRIILIDIKNRIDQGAWCTGAGKSYIPGPAPYLNQRKWEDEIIPRPEHKPKVDYSDLAQQAEFLS